MKRTIGTAVSFLVTAIAIAGLIVIPFLFTDAEVTAIRQWLFGF